MAEGGYDGTCGFLTNQENVVTQVEISISCRNLADMDVFSLSDPIVVVYEYNEKADKWTEMGRTEIIWNNLNPDFAKKFIMDYHFEEYQRLKFEVYDVDSKSKDLSKHDFLGETFCSMGEIVSVGTSTKPLEKTPKNAISTIILTTEEIAQCKDILDLQFKGRGLDKKDFFGKSDPFLTFLRTNEDSSFTVCYRTETIKYTLNPDWKLFSVPVTLLCNGDYDRPIKVECYDWNRSGRHNLIGEFVTSANQLVNRGTGATELHFQAVHPEKKAKKRSYKDSGTITLVRSSLRRRYSFLEFIRSGTELNCTVAIDFTQSNGMPTDRASLHYMTPSEPSPYAAVLQAVGRIIQDYDTDRIFPAYGFGAKLPPDFTVSHCFPLNGNFSDANCAGIEGMLHYYQQCARTVRFSGPTNFAPVINRVAEAAKEDVTGLKYEILLILTDGIISDMPFTTDAIVAAATLPFSIIIVGIGDANFDAMDVLDGDDVRLTSRTGQSAARDIVQFVPFRDFISNQTAAAAGQWRVAQSQLTRAVLDEIPEQLVSFMEASRIAPAQVSAARDSASAAAAGATSAYSAPSLDAPPPAYTRAPPSGHR